MTRSLISKEMRELLPLIVVASLVQLWPLGGALQWPHFELGISGTSIPFVGGEAVALMFLVAVLFGALAGLWQTLGESMRGTWHFFLHRPASRSSLIGGKLLIGGGLTLAIMGLPLAIYTIWAALPATHASPFRWSMCFWAWQLLPVALCAYFACFLSALRPARWYGTCLWPAAAALLVLVVMPAFISFPLINLVGAPLVIALDVLFVMAILRTAQDRDFS